MTERHNCRLATLFWPQGRQAHSGGIISSRVFLSVCSAIGGKEGLLVSMILLSIITAGSLTAQRRDHTTAIAVQSDRQNPNVLMKRPLTKKQNMTSLGEKQNIIIFLHPPAVSNFARRRAGAPSRIFLRCAAFSAAAHATHVHRSLFL